LEQETKILSHVEKGKHRHWKNFLDKDYLGSHNLEPGEEMLLTIDAFVGDEKVKTADGEKEKQVLYFKEDVPKMIMNITNGNTLTQLYGSHPEGWVGKQIQIYATPVKAFGKTQDALRIRDFIPKIVIDLNKWTSKLMEAKNLDEMGKIWKSFPQSVAKNGDMIQRKNDLKATFTDNTPTDKESTA